MALATLSIDLEARLGKLQQDLDKAGRIAEKNADQIRASYARIGAVTAGLGASIAAAFAGFSVVAFVKGNADAIDALNDVKDATGASIENISGLEQVALKTGATLATVSDVLIKFNKGLSEGNPNGPITQTLKSIGLSAEELRKIDPAEALRLTAIALSGYADDGNKARIIQELFGKSVKEAAPFLVDLAAAGELNGKVTTQQAEETEKFNKQIFEMKTNTENSARSIASSLIPTLNALFETYKKFGVTGLLKNAFGFDDLSKDRASLELLNAEVQRAGDNVDRLAEGLRRDPGNERLANMLDKAKGRLEQRIAEALTASAALIKAANAADPGATTASDVDYGREGYKKLKPSAPNLPNKPDNAAANAAASAAAAEEKRFEKLIKKLKERLAVSQQELATGEKISESSKLRLDVESELSSVKLSEPHREAVKAMLERAVASSKLLEQQVEGANLTAQETREVTAHTQALNGQNLALREQYEELGLNVRQVDALRIKRLEEAASKKEQQLAALQLLSADSSNYAQMQLNIDALREQIRLRKESAGKTEAISRDPIAGAQSALADYNDKVLAVGTATKDAFTSTINSAEDTLANFFTTGQLNAGKFASEVIAQILRIALVKPLVNAAASFIGAAIGIPGFASGGNFGGGLRIVGENGPELEATGPARIYNADQTKDMLNPINRGGGSSSSRSTTVNFAPVYQIDGTADRSQSRNDMAQIAQQSQKDLMGFLKAKGII